MGRKRSKFFIDRSVQGALVFRVVYYWALCAWALFVMLATFPIVYIWWHQTLDPGQVWQIVQATWLSFCYPMLASVLLLPFLIWDIVHVSHRYVGPIYRLRNALHDLAEGRPVAPIQFRQDDLWSELAEHFNRVAVRLQEDPRRQATVEPLDDSTAWEEESIAV